MTCAFRRASHHSVNKKISKIEIVLSTKLSKAWLKLIIVIVQSKTEIVQTMHIVRSVARIIGETVSK